jgi:beta-mannosidase
MNVDGLAGAAWECCATAPGAANSPEQLRDLPGGWLPATVPGTAASSMRAAHGSSAALAVDYDAEDWWFRTRFEGVPGPHVLRFEGLATLVDAWLDGSHLLHSENMFRSYEIDIDELDESNELTLRFAALAPELARRRPRPRWKSTLVRDQNLRWYRTTLLGRMPGWAAQAAPVGPWRSVLLRKRADFEVVRRVVDVSVVYGIGVVELSLSLAIPAALLGTAAAVRVGDVRCDVTLEPEIHCTVRVPEPSLWWPHTHGEPHLYPVMLESAAGRTDLGNVGFRTVEADTAGSGFALVVNGVSIFARGACWVSLDALSLNATKDDVRTAVLQLRDAGLNLIRITGTMVYEASDFFDACDEFGMLLWQDAMISTLDPPDDTGFVEDFEAEFREQCSMLRGRPSIAVICGGSESEQQPAFMGLPAAQRHIDLIERVVPEIARAVLPDVPYVTSSPTGGDLPTRLDEGVTQYFGVGAYLRPLTDVRAAGVRFAAECLAFSIPPERATVDAVFGSPSMAGHHPRWKQAVPRDATAAWDFEDVRDFYVRQIFGVDPMLTRYADPERALDLGRAAVAQAFETVFGYWRRSDSDCAGAVVLSARDLWPGAGWGLVDALGRPKAPWYVLRRLLAPLSIFVTDEGLDGLLVHAVNDTASALTGRLEVELYDPRGRRVVSGDALLDLPPRTGRRISLSSVLDGFRDVNHAYRFGPAGYDVVRVLFVADGGPVTAATVHLLEQSRSLLPDIGLTAQAWRDSAGWVMEIATRDTAQWIAIDIPGFRPDDCWFHLAPATSRMVRLVSEDSGDALPRGYVRALNSLTDAGVRVTE